MKKMIHACVVAVLLLSVAMLQTAMGQESNSAAAGEQQAATIESAVDPLTLAEATQTARSYGLRVLFAVLVLVLASQLIRAAVFALERLSERSAQRRLLYKRLIPITRLVVWGFALFFILRGIFNVDAQGLLTAAAAIGVAVGFAAQDILKNIFGGLVIVADRPFQVGDKIKVGGTYGEVISIGLRSTRIQTADDNAVSVPNAQIVDNQVSNANAGQLHCQVVTDLYLPGSANERKAKDIAYQAAASSKYAYLEKPISVVVKDEFSHAHVLHLLVKAYVLDARYELLFLSDITERARAAFREAGLLTAPSGKRKSNGANPKHLLAADVDAGQALPAGQDR